LEDETGTKTPAANVKNTYNNYGNHNGDVKF
jgi:hypothetical protein